MHNICNGHSSDVVCADFFRNLLQLAADLDFVWFAFPVRTQHCTPFLASFSTMVLLFVRSEATLTKNSPRRKSKAFIPGHGYNVAFKAAFKDTPMALIYTEGRLAVVSGPLVCF